VHFIDDWQLDLQSGIGDGANDFTEPCNDGVFVLMDNEQAAFPIERVKNEKNPEIEHQRALQKARIRETAADEE